MTKNNGPERIFAMVNGMSTRLPDGKRQFIWGWSEDSDRPRAIEYVRADAVEGLVEALEFICDGYANQDVNHVDYRVKSYQAALAALSRFRSVEGGENG